MKKIFALFDDPDAIQRARNALEKAGRGDEVVKVVGPQQRTNPRHASSVVDPEESTSGPVVVNQAGQTAPRMPVDAFVSPLERLDLSSDEHEHFEQMMSKGSAQVLVLEVDEDDRDARMQMMKDHDAEYVTSN